MQIIIWIVTALLVLTCIFLILLVLVQLPKKEAGAGMAFGGGTADALLGSGSGTALTKFTGYVVAVFFVLTLCLTLMRTHEDSARTSAVADALKKESSQKPVPSTVPMASTNVLKTTPGMITTQGTNKLPVTTTNAPGKN
ncbi:MAG: preprotein translocase subunit SecG [Opitutaceae bacterium]|nr:preprotein translocase subunit SecG [Verrucomicrobiales bacterium]